MAVLHVYMYVYEFRCKPPCRAHNGCYQYSVATQKNTCPGWVPDGKTRARTFSRMYKTKEVSKIMFAWPFLKDKIWFRRARWQFGSSSPTMGKASCRKQNNYCPLYLSFTVRCCLLFCFDMCSFSVCLLYFVLFIFFVFICVPFHFVYYILCFISSLFYVCSFSFCL